MFLQILCVLIFFGFVIVVPTAAMFNEDFGCWVYPDAHWCAVDAQPLGKEVMRGIKLTEVSMQG